MTMSDDVQTLKLVPLFATMDDTELSGVRAIMDDNHYAPGQTIIHENEPTGDFHVIVQGAVEFLIADATGQEMVLDTAAKYFVYRVTWVDEGTPLAKAISEFNDVVDREVNGRAVFGKAATNGKFKEMFSKVMVARFRELTDLELITNARSILYGAQMYPALGRMGQEEVGVYLQDGKLVTSKSYQSVIASYIVAEPLSNGTQERIASRVDVLETV